MKTQIEVLTIIGDILKQMTESQANGVSRMSYYIEDVQLNDLFKIYESLKGQKNNVNLYFIGEYFNDDTIDVCYRVIPGYIIYITSTKQTKLKPKINVINYN